MSKKIIKISAMRYEVINMMSRQAWISLFVMLFVFPSLANSGDIKALRKCMKHWDKHPFSSTGKLKYRTLRTSVKILGIGNDVTDNIKTKKPELILIKPSIGVLTKRTYRLMNPNGWYCFKANVTVLGKSEIIMDCKTHAASRNAGVEIGGSGASSGGVTVLGTAAVKRVGCK